MMIQAGAAFAGCALLAAMLEWWARHRGVNRLAPVAGSVFFIATLLAIVVAVNGSRVFADALARSTAGGALVILGGVAAMSAACVIPYRMGRPMMSMVGVVTADLLAIAVVVRIGMAALRTIG